jgi:serine/threonine-protein kinase RsbT
MEVPRMESKPDSLTQITDERDIVEVRRVVRSSAMESGFGVTDVTRIVTAASELARNIYRHAYSGTMTINLLNSGNSRGMELIFADKGPGIANIEQAMEPGFTTGGGLGMGLPGARRLMDEMNITSEVKKGTTVTIRKWLR